MHSFCHIMCLQNSGGGDREKGGLRVMDCICFYYSRVNTASHMFITHFSFYYVCKNRQRAASCCNNHTPGMFCISHTRMFRWSAAVIFTRFNAVDLLCSALVLHVSLCLVHPEPLFLFFLPFLFLFSSATKVVEDKKKEPNEDQRDFGNTRHH